MCYRLLGSLGDLVYSTQRCLLAKTSFFHKTPFAGFQTGKNTSTEKGFISFWILHSNAHSDQSGLNSVLSPLGAEGWTR